MEKDLGIVKCDDPLASVLLVICVTKKYPETFFSLKRRLFMVSGEQHAYHILSATLLTPCPNVTRMN